MGDQALLNDVLQNTDAGFDMQVANLPTPGEVVASPPKMLCVSACQWSAEPNDVFRPAGPAVERIPTGVYRFGADDRGIYLERMKLVIDNLLELDDAASQRVLEGIRTFWDSEHEYTSRGIVYKRGVLLWGPAGSGKTALVTLLSQELVRRGGIVVMVTEPGMASIGLSTLRRIEPQRPLILIFEDIEEIIRAYGEHKILAILDGELQVGNVVQIATTNYPEVLGARIVNRPSRFDERIHVGMPSPAARRKYLKWITRNEYAPDADIERWVADTEGFSVAHLRELVVAMFCLKQPYDSILERLRGLHIRAKSKDEFGGSGAGFRQQGIKVPVIWSGVEVGVPR